MHSYKSNIPTYIQGLKIKCYERRPANSKNLIVSPPGQHTHSFQVTILLSNFMFHPSTGTENAKEKIGSHTDWDTRPPSAKNYGRLYFFKYGGYP